MKNVIDLTINEKIVRFILEDFDEEVEVENLLKIDMENLYGELITFPVIVNRFGILLADMDNKLAETKLNLEIYTAKAKEALRTKLTETEKDAKGNVKTKKPTLDELDNSLLLDKIYQVKRRKIFEAQKLRDYVNSTFWSAKDKSNKLDKLSLTIQPGDVDIERLANKIVNGIKIKIGKGIMN